MTSYPPPPGQPPYGQGYPSAPDNNQAVWALVIAIVSVFLSCCCGVFSIAGGIAAMILAKGERDRARQWGGPYADTSMATAAYWVGVAAIVIGALSLVVGALSVVLDLALTP
ncbi:hypothetical protein [Aeromicrobium choanae]|uniref:DUF4190 domain-containing protein n=1 Tax=Aeromicrobium choanae TaxID=1736691 RepID=A0A1T4Z794_9ACTN|nr:hypothetical protein [Aeromicrobium choanae]SKB09738.1 hypothetical protein SAMN06295964_2861 [Aeromicrobium choanae]